MISSENRFPLFGIMRYHGRMDCFVYVLGTIAGARRLTYVGWTNDIDRRLKQHNAGTGARFTRGRTWVLLHWEACADRRAAMSREWHLKRDRAFRKKLAASLRTPRRKIQHKTQHTNRKGRKPRHP